MSNPLCFGHIANYNKNCYICKNCFSKNECKKSILDVMNKMENRKYVVISPHSDDALIGCYNLIAKNEVEAILYTYEENDITEYNQIQTFCNAFKIKLIKCNKDDVIKIFNTDFPKYILMVPSMNDHHPMHKKCSSLQFEINNIGIYSIDMNEQFIKELPEKNKFMKEALMDKYFPTKKSMWEYDKKYCYFEGHIIIV